MRVLLTGSGCGTTAGYQRHRGQGEDPCEPCREAKRAYEREYRRTYGQKRYDRPKGQPRPGTSARDKARLAALERLGKMYPAILQTLFREELDTTLATYRSQPERRITGKRPVGRPKRQPV